MSIEQRVKIVEERMAHHSELFADMRQGLLQDQKMDGGFAALDLKLDNGFRWTSSIMLTGLIAIVAAILSQ